MIIVKKLLAVRKGAVPYLFFISAINLLFLNLPLINVFGYEFSVLNSILIVFLSGVHSLKFFKSKLDNPNFSLKILLENLTAFLLIPFIISIINSYFNGFCSFVDGLWFYLIILLPSVIIGTGISAISILILKRFSILIFTLIYLLILTVPIFEIYFNPQVYFYNPIAGFFPGNIYDEGLTVSLALISYRLLNLVYFGGIIFFILKFNRQKSSAVKILAVSIAILISIIFIYLSPLFGFATTEKSLSNELKNEIKTEHFIIKYSSNLDSNEVKILAIRHELYYEELKLFFHHSPDDLIKSFIFSDAEKKKKLFGAGSADVAKPWLLHIYLTYDNYDRTLKHELAHCFSAEFGATIFKIAENFNASLIEGIAVAADPFYDEYPVEYMAAVAFQNGYKTEIRKMFESFNFFFQASSLSYIYAGSFSKFLIDNYGIGKFKRLYSNIDFQSIYRKTFEGLIKDYYQHLSEIDLSDKKLMADFYFGRKPIFYKVCPRYISDRLMKAWDLFQHKKYLEALKLFEDIIEKSDNYSATIGFASCIFELKRKDDAIKFLDSKLKGFEGTSYYYQMNFILADFMVEQNKYDSADSIYKEIYSSSVNRGLGSLAFIRSCLLTNGNTLSDYLIGSDSLKYELIKTINEKEYNYYSFPILINLSKSLKVEYSDFLKVLNKPFLPNNSFTSYSLLKLSEYMFENLDFIRSRKIAALALRFSSNKYETELLEDHFAEIDWVVKNSGIVLNKISIINTK